MQSLRKRVLNNYVSAHLNNDFSYACHGKWSTFYSVFHNFSRKLIHLVVTCFEGFNKIDLDNFQFKIVPQ